MKIVYLQGGMGNQLFQYAFARALEFRFGCTVKLDDSFFRQQIKREFCLDKFNTRYKIASKSEVEKALNLKNTPLQKVLGFYFRSSGKNSRCVEKTLSFDDEYLSKKHKLYFKGYWQNERYFKNIEEILRVELTITPAPFEQNATLINEIKADKNSVSLHVRRGDYINESQTYKIHGVCSLDYYRVALNLLKLRIGKFNLYIFSDDMDWVKQNLEFTGNMVFVDWNDDRNNHEDLRLMSFCKHNIIANSSFSWWGAWLNQNPNKIVIAPRQWFPDAAKNEEAKDIVPSSWIKI